ncbi:unnamed protein product, partial [Ectocarpus sp. 12 AP-2014]
MGSSSSLLKGSRSKDSSSSVDAASRKNSKDGRKQATAALQALKGKPRDVGEAEDAASSTWAHARAALVLRTEGVSVALRWVSAAKAIQVAFRGFRCRSSYRALLARRRRAATMIQSAERRKRACATAADLREQRASPWEQLWDDENGR